MRPFAVALCLASSFAWAGESEAPVLRVTGNKALPAAVYEVVARIPEGALVDDALADRVEGTIRQFLRQSGYVLARVSARVKDSAIELDINEGQLEQVVFHGPLTLQRVRMALTLTVPYRVFNRTDFTSQVARLEQELNLPIRWQLEPTRHVDHVGPQLTDSITLRGVDFFPGEEKFELHVRTGDAEWPVGLGFDVRTSWLDGFEAGPSYQGTDSIVKGGRWRLSGTAGVGLAGSIIPFNLTPLFTRATLRAAWFGPNILNHVRPGVQLDGDHYGRQRLDLGLSNYQLSSVTPLMSLAVGIVEGLEFTVAGGAHLRGTYGLSAVDPTTSTYAPSTAAWPYLLAKGDLRLTPADERFDWEHRLSVNARFFFGPAQPSWGDIELRYRKTFRLGWHELRLRGNGSFQWGQVPFHDEVPLADPHLLGAFGDTWVRRAVSASADFRFSLSRDAWHVGAFINGALFGLYDAARTRETLGLGVSGGPSMHFLLEGTLSFDLIISVGVARGGFVRVAPLLFINKVF